MTLLFGKIIPPFYTGLLVIIMTLIVALGQLKKSNVVMRPEKQIENDRKKLGNLIFLPSLLPLLTFAGAEFLASLKIADKFLFDSSNSTLFALGIACIICWIAAILVTKKGVKSSFFEEYRLPDAISWTLVLPQPLATLGTIFTEAGIGKAVSKIITSVVPDNSLFWTVVVFCLGMAIFTLIMGNASGIAVPLLIKGFGATPEQIGALAMFSGYCGTLMTPMAAEFNIVPASLLELDDKNLVVKVQIPTALFVLAFNVLLMYTMIKFNFKKKEKWQNETSINRIRSIWKR